MWSPSAIGKFRWPVARARWSWSSCTRCGVCCCKNLPKFLFKVGGGDHPFHIDRIKMKTGLIVLNDGQELKVMFLP